MLSVPLWKIVVLSLTTWGVYQVVWFFRPWRRQASLEACSPILRSLFSVLFYYSLGRAVRDRQLGADIRPAATAGALAVCYLFFQIVWKAPEPYFLGGLLSFLPILVTQHEINRLNVAIGSTEPVDRFGWPAIAAVALGGPLLLLATVGAFLEPLP